MADWRTSIENWFNSITSPTLERDNSGTNWMVIDTDGNSTESMTNLAVAQNHPILTPGVLFISNLFAQAKFKIKNKKDGTEILKHDLLSLLERPNIFQTKIDFLEQLQFLKIAQGRVAIYLKRGTGLGIDSMYLLLDHLIEYPENLKKGMPFRSQRNLYLGQKIVYDREGLNIDIKLDDIIWLHDIPPVVDEKNRYKNVSRITGLHQTLQNTIDSLIAKNIIVKSNGKEMLSGNGGDSFPFSKTEQDSAKTMWNSNYGLGTGRSRLYLTKSNVNWKSLHIALRDLGLDESTKTDCNIVYTALHIPPDVLSLDRKKTTYNNYRESLSSFIQNDIQAMLNDFLASLNELIEDDSLVVEGDYRHLPTMQFLKKREYESARTQAEALLKLRLAGIPDKDALSMVGLPNTMKLMSLEELAQISKPEKEEAESSGESEESEAGESNQEDGGNDE